MMPDLAAVAEQMITPTSLGLVLLGSFLGVTVGAIPGLTGAMLIALSLPLTFSMNAEHALILLVSMYVGSVSGGLITATLLRIPGTPASMMTTLDGYPMAQAGEAGRALGLGIGASLIGGLVSWVFLITLSAPMAQWSLLFGPYDFFALVLVALVLIASVGEGSPLVGLLAGFLGILAAMPGASPATGLTRWTFGFHELDDGFKLLPVLIGLFAVNQVIRQCLSLASGASRSPVSADWGANRQRENWIQHAGNLLRSSLIGTGVGILPGIGANIGSVIAYSAAKNASRHPERFGTGSAEGIVAAESANNATVGGALIPLIAMGIPGSVIDAILLGALVIHGLQPGPLLMQQNPLAVHTIMFTLLAAIVCVYALMRLFTRWIVKLADIPQWLLIPTVMTFCVIGSFALASRMFDVWVMLGFGVIGFGLERILKIPLAPFVIGFVLAPIAEEHLSAGLMQHDGSLLPLMTSPISAFFCTTAAFGLGWTLWRYRKSTSVG
jgi:putative tricarboxylic transport membrane protein